MMKKAVAAAAILLFLGACEQQEQTAPPATAEPAKPAAEAPPAPGAQPPAGQEAAPAEIGQNWQGLPGADKLTYAIDLQQGQKVYEEACATCHREGVAGAPQLGNVELWQERLAKGLPTLVENSIKGFQGNLGVMPPKGGAQSLTDEQVASAVVYMAQQVGQQP